jgi:RNA polymerase sigma-70 factor (ECF subfamily)
MSGGIFDKVFWNKILKQIVRRTRDTANAEDLLQSAYLRLEKYRANHTVENPAAFLIQTAVNIHIDEYRRTRQLSTILADSELSEVSDQPLQDEVICARARLERVKAGLERLPRRTRDIFLMHRLDGLRYREIADCFGISQSAVEKHIAKAVVFLADWTEDW